MDQTDFSLLAGFFVGSHAGAFGLQAVTGWSLLITYPTGGLIGFVVVTVIAYRFVEWSARRKNPPKAEQGGGPTSSLVTCSTKNDKA
jgi:hypothetical protein